MIKAFAPTNTTVELKIQNTETREEFDADLARIHSDINNMDLLFDKTRHIWRVNRADLYHHISYVRAAIHDRNRQIAFDFLGKP